MTRKKLILIITGIIIFLQILFFRTEISFNDFQALKVKGLACTCPDESVLKGQEYLKSITPDSLKAFNLDYSEIYVTERPSSFLDYMGVKTYLINGKVIGKKRVYEKALWNPLFQVNKWTEFDTWTIWAIRIIILIQIIIWTTYLKIK